MLFVLVFDGQALDCHDSRGARGMYSFRMGIMCDELTWMLTSKVYAVRASEKKSEYQRAMEAYSKGINAATVSAALSHDDGTGAGLDEHEFSILQQSGSEESASEDSGSEESASEEESDLEESDAALSHLASSRKQVLKVPVAAAPPPPPQIVAPVIPAKLNAITPGEAMKAKKNPVPAIRSVPVVAQVVVPATEVEKKKKHKMDSSSSSGIVMMSHSLPVEMGDEEARKKRKKKHRSDSESHK